MRETEEIAQRRKEYQIAIASTEMEGFVFTDEDRHLFEKVIQGQILEDKAIEDYKKYLVDLKKERPELFAVEDKALNLKANDSYCYKGTYILKNKFDILAEEELNKAERLLGTIRNRQLLENSLQGNFDYEHLKKIHYYLFQDLYDWAGEARNVNISKGGTLFCTVQNILSYANSIFNSIKKDNYLINLEPEQFIIKLAGYLADINELHPFREGNGRTQREFIRLLALNAGYELDLSKTSQKAMIEASIQAHYGLNVGFVKIIKSSLKSIN